MEAQQTRRCGSGSAAQNTKSTSARRTPADSAGRSRPSQLGEGPAHVMGGEPSQLDVAEVGDDRLENVAVELDSLFGSAVEPFRQPVIHRLAERVARGSLHARVMLGMQFPELGRDLSPGPPGNLLPTPGLAIRAVPEGDGRIPAALGLVFVDRPLAAPAAPQPGSWSAHSREHNTSCSP